MNPLSAYYQLRNELDQRCVALSQEHTAHLQCQAGCDSCCMAFNIFPLELEAIRQEAADKLQLGQTPPTEDDCPFLVDHQCVIYQSRPFICRTQGLPLLFVNDEEWELSVCELNFTEYDFAQFSEDNTFAMDRYNSRLFMLNRQYLESLPNSPFSPTDLLPLSQLLKR